MNFNQDTIAAQSTAAGKGAIHIIRLSGADAIKICDKIFKAQKTLAETPSRYATFGKIYACEQLIDEVLITVFRAPDSYTGEDVVEISCHGNQYIAAQILENILQFARLADPGEFTQRAFLNNKLDLTQAEAVGDLLSASTRFSHKTAIDQMEGRLKQKISNILDIITEIRIALELEIDFPEDYQESISLEDIETKISRLKKDLEMLVKSGRDGMILRNGYRVSLVGRPNVGKSSIFNALLDSERAIVTPVPGTTRDYLEEAIALSGFLIVFYDTAGLRDSEDALEKLGMARSMGIIDKSDLVIYVTDSEMQDNEINKLEETVKNKKLLKVLNKTDIIAPTLISEYLRQDYIPCSTVISDGLNELKTAILQEINIKPEEFKVPPLTNTRQLAAARKALNELLQFQETLKSEGSIEFLAFDLLQVSKALEEITGVITTDDILDKIFSSYCIGK
ncbi:MAG: tRNA uridine-5-carboxymethylaminomethyl(34) synthesis GTPase MnmE [Candidatus Stygibacter australis]|nr:tRNA uridine-5-carboxymethylaminomethyl(34) synthesis GTPase MnmE [Candidatus Stygibacter australis]MDP8321014.1 tRNA uridine-5-carboxymethylaminomethyl(34) synthesis GTPase MnmE [Candidatus Stygibacter australis]